MRMTTRATRTPRPALTKEIPRVGGDSVANHGGGLSGSLKFHFYFLINGVVGYIVVVLLAQQWNANAMQKECLEGHARRVTVWCCSTKIILFSKEPQREKNKTYNRNKVFIGQE